MNKLLQPLPIVLSLVILTETISIIYLIYKSKKQNIQINDLEIELKKQIELKKNERMGRISVQQANRELLSKIQFDNGYNYEPIATIDTPFPYLRGTPRQPSLVPSAKGLIRFNKKIIQYAHYKELEQFSHIWIIFIFHNNTNTEKQNKVTKIKPPRLHGQKVGVLSTRSPHRPNNIGLSVCEIVNVCEDYLEVKGIDFVHGTPILDIKPYIPYDVIPSKYILPMATSANGDRLPIRELQVPDWVVDTDITLLPVRVTIEAKKVIEYAIHLIHNKKSLKSLVSTVEEAIELISQVLRQDIRGVNQGRGNTKPITRSYIENFVTDINYETTENKLSQPVINQTKQSLNTLHINTTISNTDNSNDNSNNNEDDRDKKNLLTSLLYTCTLDIFHIQFETTENEIIVQKISLTDNFTQL